MKAYRLIYLCLTATMLMYSSTDHALSQDSLTVEIIPTRILDSGSRVIELNSPGQHFSVCVTNVSNESIRIWAETYSRGYYALSFIIIDDGHEIILKKRIRSWLKNVPFWTTLKPSEAIELEVSFDRAIWPAIPPTYRENPLIVDMMAVFEIKADDRTNDFGVWTGRVKSPEHTYIISR